MQTLNLSNHDLERIEELKKTYGFEVLDAGFTGVVGTRTVQMCYWHNKRGVRESALFPNHEAAWRDALRVHEAAVDEVKANPGVHRLPVMPAKDSQYLSVLKRKMMIAGFVFGDREWTRGELTVGGHESHAATIKDAIKIWARDNPDDFIDAMNELSQGLTQVFGPASAESKELLLNAMSAVNQTDPDRFWLTPLSSEELANLQGFPGYAELPDRDKLKVIESQQLLKHMVQRGIKIDTSKLSEEQRTLLDLNAGGVHTAHKAQGKSFEEVEEDQRNSKRAYGVVEGSEEEKQLRHLEAIGYEFFFTSTSGWVCKQIDRSVVAGALETVVKAAWGMAMDELNGKWDGTGQPPVGTTLWVIPHNTLWGFDLVDTYLCEVLAYHNDFVWLQLLSDTGEVVLGKYVTTRTDKVDVKVWKGNNNA